MRDFYSLGAFFADIQEPIIGRREGGMVVASAEDQKALARLDAAVDLAQKHLEALAPQLDAAQAKWEAGLSTGPSPCPSSPVARRPRRPRNRARAVQAAIRKDATPARKKARRPNLFSDESDAAVPGRARRLARAASAGVRRRPAEMPGERPQCHPATVRILPRGNWMDETGEVVKPALPQYLPRPVVTGRDLTRLDLARWLVSRDNPLTARTVMNRLWKQFFGAGLSRQLDDLGAQGEPPSNPALLDWLACEFMDSGWDVKHMVHTIVTSETYKQTSVATPKLLADDPLNRELARQSAYRIDAELVRDQALAVSGLLVAKIGGPSVKPYQPDGYWENLNFPERRYVADQGDAQHRRGLYTWWQRSFLHPSLLAFDAPSREECCAERARSNIPQQALVLLNDPTYVEAARAFAARVLRRVLGPA